MTTPVLAAPLPVAPPAHPDKGAASRSTDRASDQRGAEPSFPQLLAQRRDAAQKAGHPRQAPDQAEGDRARRTGRRAPSEKTEAPLAPDAALAASPGAVSDRPANHPLRFDATLAREHTRWATDAPVREPAFADPDTPGALRDSPPSSATPDAGRAARPVHRGLLASGGTQGDAADPADIRITATPADEPDEAAQAASSPMGDRRYAKRPLPVGPDSDRHGITRELGKPQRTPETDRIRFITQGPAPVENGTSPLSATGGAPDAPGALASLAATAATPAGPAPADAAAPLVRIHTPLGQPLWAQDFSRQIVALAREQATGVQIVRMHVNPPDLGPIHIALHMSDTLAHANFVSPHASVRQALENALPQLGQQLAEAGVSLGQTHVGDQGAGQQAFAEPGEPAAHSTLAAGPSAAAQSVTAASQPDSARGHVRRPHALVDTFA